MDKEHLKKKLAEICHEVAIKERSEMVQKIASTEILSSQEVVDMAYKIAYDGVEVADVPSQRLDAAIRMAIWMRGKFKESEKKE